MDKVSQASFFGLDVIIVPGGSSAAKADLLKASGIQAIRDFVGNGGGYVGICGGAYFASKGFPLDIVNEEAIHGEIDSGEYAGEETSYRGFGDVRIVISDAGREIFPDVDEVSVSFTSGPVFSKLKRQRLSVDCIPLAFFTTEIWELPSQRGTMLGTGSICASRFRKGRVILFSPHPELTPGLGHMIEKAVRAVAVRGPTGAN